MMRYQLPFDGYDHDITMICMVTASACWNVTFVTMLKTLRFLRPELEFLKSGSGISIDSKSAASWRPHFKQGCSEL